MISDLFHQSHPKRNTLAKIPGKLYLAGEYAILTPNQPALIMSVNRFITVKIKQSTNEQQNWIVSGEKKWMYQRDSNTYLTRDDLSLKDQDFWKYTHAAIQLIEELVRELKLPLMDYQITIESDLIDLNGQKIGFGSSGAVTLAIIFSLLKLYGLRPHSELILYKLGAIAQTRLNVQGSFGDLAASSYGGIVLYQSLDRTWLEQQLKSTQSICSLLKSDWPDLHIVPVQEPLSINIYFGWTGKPASTEGLVSSLKEQLPQNPAPYRSFVANASITVTQLFDALESKDTHHTIRLINVYHDLLDQLNSDYNLNILTDPLIHLIKTAHHLNMGAKSSGAGGGDCGIAVEDNNLSNKNKLFSLWREGGVIPLSLQLAPKTF